MVFLEISQNSQENTCAGISFLIKLQAKQDTLTQVFSFEFCEISKKISFLQNTSGRLLLDLEADVFMSLFTTSEYTKLVPGRRNNLHAECGLHRIIVTQVHFQKGALMNSNYLNSFPIVYAFLFIETLKKVLWKFLKIKAKKQQQLFAEVLKNRCS